jgi:hypothetical protein
MKPIKLDTIPEEVNGMKTRLFARYINWFNKNISPRNFYFNYFMHDRKDAIISCKEMKRRDLDGYDLILRRISPKEGQSGNCDSVGCFTGWSINCSFIIPDKKERIEYDKTATFRNYSLSTIESNEFGRIIGINNKVSNFMFMPDNIYPWRNGYDMTNEENAAWQDVGSANIFITKMEMLHRCAKFLDYVVDGTINPNPIARMSEAEADDLTLS